jgi:hypothetical protein
VPAAAVLPAMLALACLTLTACGTGEKERDAAAVTERFHSALEREDGRAACGELSAAAARAVEREEGRSCADAILSLDLPRGAAAGASRVYLRSASVELADGSATFLSEGPAGWKVTADGCTPTSPDQPHECELEG